MPQTTTQLFVKPLQYVEETTEGTTPTSSPTFLAVGASTTLEPTMNGNYIEISQIGPEDLHSLAPGLTTWESTMQYQPTDVTFITYGINAQNFASPAGTISRTLSLMFSFYLNGVNENYVFLKGTRTKSVSYTKEVGKADVVNFSFVHTTISTPSTSNGLTTPTLVSTFPSGAVFDWTSGGAASLGWNGSKEAKKVTINIERNTTMEYTLGSTTGYGSAPHGRRIKGSFTVIYTTTSLEADYKANTSRTLTLVCKTAAGTITVTGAKITSYKRSYDAEDTGAIIEECEFEGTAVSVA